ncbi:MAG: CDP-alcohol phosphatidyltransferase family protein, partial [Candidatus Neomarinimicrobiota bacterium]
SAFISFAVLGLIDYWMVGLIIFRDLFVTGLRIIMSAKGFTLLTSKIAKAKTGTQITIIIATLLFLGAKGFLQYSLLKEIIGLLIEYRVIYYLTGVVALFTLYTGLTYVYENRKAIEKLFG